MSHIPKWIEQLLERVLPESISEFVIGDLEEYFTIQSEQKGLLIARLIMLWNVFSVCFSLAFKKIRSNSTHPIMIRHHVLIAFRNFKKHKVQFWVNLTGLGLALTCVLLIYLWVSDEYQMNRFHKNGDHMYQVFSNHQVHGEDVVQIITPGSLLDAIQEEVPEVEQVVAWLPFGEAPLSVDKTFHRCEGMFASKAYLQVFSHPLISGNPRQALNNKNSLVVSESLAIRLFGERNPMGKSVLRQMNGVEVSLEVTGVMADVSNHELMPFDYLMSWDLYQDDIRGSKSWTDYYALITCLFGDEVDEQQLAATTDRLNEILRKNNDNAVDLLLVKYPDLYLYDEFENGKLAGGRIQYVRLMIVVALLILLIACVNFINLSTAGALSRRKEVGVKKIIGATSSFLIWQYLVEYTLLAALAMVVGWGLAVAALPFVNQILSRHLAVHFDWVFVLITLGLPVIIGILAGIYPSIYMTRSCLRLIPQMTKGNSWGRKVLVTVQFAVAIMLLSAVVVVYQQMSFIQNKNLGYDRENLISIEREGKLLENPEPFLNQLRSVSGVESAVLASFSASSFNWTGAISWPEKSSEENLQFHQLWVGAGAVEALALELIEGRTFAEDIMDQSSVILNQSAAAVMGFENPIGQTINHWTGMKKIVGVVKDYHFRSLHTEVGPSVILYSPPRANKVLVKFSQDDFAPVLKAMAGHYEDFNPGYVFYPRFLSNEFEEIYETEQQIAVLSTGFAGFSILISWIGLVGLTMFVISRRVKEIGIRKVLGSDAWRTVILLSREYVFILLISTSIAIPTIHYFASFWLENFVYHVQIRWWVHLLAGAVCLCIALSTVCIQALKAASANPIKLLRSE